MMDNEEFRKEVNDIIKNILEKSQNNQVRQASLEKEEKERALSISYKNKVIDKYTLESYLTLKKNLLENTLNGRTIYNINDYGDSNKRYDDIWLSQIDFIGKYKILLLEEKEDPRISFTFKDNSIHLFLKEDLDEKDVKDNDGFMSSLASNLLEFQRKKKEKEEEKKRNESIYAMLTFEHILKKMTKASERGISEIEYDPLFISPPDYFETRLYFSYHQRWLYESNSDIIVWMEPNNVEYQTEDGWKRGYNLCWRKKTLSDNL